MTRPTGVLSYLSPASFDALFDSQAHSPGFAHMAQLADPALPPEVEPFSFLSRALLYHIAHALDLRPGDVLTDLGCGRGGPGLWLARAAGAHLLGLDFSPSALSQARRRALRFGMDQHARFVLGDLTAPALPTSSVHAAVSIDALQYATNRDKAAREAHRILQPGGRIVLTGWHPRTPGDPRLPARHRDTDWPATLRTAGFLTPRCASHPEWTETYLRTYRFALHQGNPGTDAALAALQDEARQRLPTAHLLRRVLITATTPRV